MLLHAANIKTSISSPIAQNLVNMYWTKYQGNIVLDFTDAVNLTEQILEASFRLGYMTPASVAAEMEK